MPHKKPDTVVCIQAFSKSGITFLAGHEYDSFPTKGVNEIFYWVGVNRQGLVHLNNKDFEEHFEVKKESVPT